MRQDWPNGTWEDVSGNYSGPHESRLLKLNCDKALHFLGWRPVWDFTDTVRNTSQWYRKYYDSPSLSIADFSINQIKSYIIDAKSKGLSWAL